VVAIPSSVFYGGGVTAGTADAEQTSGQPAGQSAGQTLVRWAFCKRDEVLADALARLASWS
jgi:hypothetical protein